MRSDDLQRLVDEHQDRLRAALGWRRGWTSLRVKRFNRVHLNLGTAGFATASGWVLEEVGESGLVTFERAYLGTNLQDAATALTALSASAGSSDAEGRVSCHLTPQTSLDVKRFSAPLTSAQGTDPTQKGPR